MPVVTVYSAGYADPALQKPNIAIHANAREVLVPVTVPVANGDNINSLYFIGKVPSSAKLLADSTIYHTAIAGLTSVNIQLALGTTIVAIAAAQNLTVAGTKSMLASIAVPNLAQQVWQLLGLLSDPGREVDVRMSLATDATAAGSVHCLLKYAVAV